MFRFSFYGIIIPVVIFLFVSIDSQAQVIYVDDSAVGANDGSSWEDAFNSLSNALALASSGDQVWVAEGRYIPEDVENGFVMRTGISLYGGFSGLETELEERDWLTFFSILTGDNLGDDILDDFISNKEDNAKHVLFADFNVDTTAVLDGFVVRGGHSTSILSGTDGGGILCEGSPTIRNCTFTDNVALNGGAIALFGNASNDIIVEDCEFSGNYASINGGALLINGLNLEHRIHNCVFSQNSAGEGGGAVSILSASPEFFDCVFSENTAVIDGGAIWSEGFLNFSRMKYYDCEFTTNSTSTGAGGAVFIGPSMRGGFDNCLVDQNFAEIGGGIASIGDSIGVDHGVFTNNMATDGGAIDANSTIFCTINETDFEQNVATGNGGAISAIFSVTDFNKCYFANNEASTGGAIFAENLETILVNCILTGNFANNGGGFYGNDENSFFLIHSLLWKNEAINLGPGFAAFSSSNVFVGNSIIWGNIGPSLSQENTGPNSDIILENSNIQGYNSPENISQAPLFIDEPNGDYNPQPNSAVVNAGEPTINNLPLDDFAGNPRDALPDIGPFELQVEPPVAPLNLIGDVQAPFKVVLSWIDTNDNEDQYIIERSIQDSTSFAVLNTLPANSVSYEDLGLTPGTTYFYRVRARRLQFFSEYSNMVEVLIPEEFPDNPDNLSIIDFTDATVSLAWEDNSDDEISFVLERKDTPTGVFEVIDETIFPNVTSYEDSGLMSNTLYSYRIKSRAITGDSEYSNSVVVTTEMGSGIGEAALVAIQLYPNPATDFVNLTLSPNFNPIQSNILNAKGQIVKVIQLNGNETQISVNDLSLGQYFVELKNENGSVRLPFVKK